jgi:pimeloyl-ACP methyl ester carboxylesterase
MVMLHGFPTWSHDWAAVATLLEKDFDIVTMDFLGYGASDKPKAYNYSVPESADCVEDLMAHLKLSSIHLVSHDYGGMVTEELLDRRLSNKLPFQITGLAVLNRGIVYSEYRPTILQRLLVTPIIGGIIASRITASTLRPSLQALWGKAQISDEQFDDMWYGMALNDGHKLAYLHIRYNVEREKHHRRWAAATAAWEGPLHLIWGLDDPVSGRHVLEKAKQWLPHAVVTELDGVGHWPPIEAPEAVAEAIRQSTSPEAPLHRASL